MNKWFVVHDLLAYEQHPDMISNVVRQTEIKKPKFKKFKNIQHGDLIVYYATKDMVVVGIFRVVSGLEYVKEDPYWGEVMVYKIVPYEMPPNGKYLDFKALLTTPDISFDMFPVKVHWGKYLQGRTCILLSDNDFQTIESSLLQNKYLKNKDEILTSATRWHDKHGKHLENLIPSLSTTGKDILVKMMSFETKGRTVVRVEDLVSLSEFRKKGLLDDSLYELNRKRLLKFTRWRKSSQRFSLTIRGRAVALLLSETS